MPAQDQNSIYQDRLAQIKQLPPDQQQMALEALSRDYPGMEASAKADRSFGEEMAMGGQPEGTVAGPGSNPYTAYVAASPVEHAASALRSYKGYKDRGEAKDQMNQMAKQKQQALMDMLRSGVKPPGGGGMPGMGGMGMGGMGMGGMGGGMRGM